MWMSIQLNNTLFNWLLIGATYASVLWIYEKDRRISKLPYQNLLFLYLGWVVICSIRGALIAENYWEYKSLIQGTASVLMPLLIWVLASPDILSKILKIWTRLALPIFGLIYFILEPMGYGNYLAPLVLFVLLLPLLRFPQQILVLGFTGIVIFSNLDGRSNILRFGLPFAFMGLFLCKNFIGTAAIRAGAIAFFIIPPVLLALGSSGTFNIFRMQEYLQADSIDGNTATFQTVTADTRTGLYIEVWDSAVDNGYQWAGRTLARGYDSKSFGKGIQSLTGTGKIERYSSEVGMHNIFTWMGIPGVVLYSAIFFMASYLAINRSNNFALKVVGLYIAFRWSYCWVEEFTTFSINYFALWMLVAICWSPRFRAMSDNEIRDWVRTLVPNLLRRRTPRKVHWSNSQTA